MDTRILYQLCIVLIKLLDNVTEASFIYSHVGDDVQFSWSLNPVPDVNDVINIKNPNDYAMFFVSGTEVGAIQSPYTGRIVYTGNTATGQMKFTLKQITRLDAGVYKASKAGAAGSPVYQGPTLFVLELSPLVINKNLHLNCSTSSTTVPGNHNLSMTYIWNIDGVNITSSTGRYLVFDSSISIQNIKTNDKNKTITCTGTEQGGLTSDISNNYILLDHLYGPLTVTFTPSTTSYSITEQGTIPDITCTADCKPNCSYIWTKDGQVTSHVSGSTMLLRNINRNDTGVYRCTAWNVYGTKNSSYINVDVKYGPGTVIFSSLSTNYSLAENATIHDITCTADCKPNCSYRWTKNGRVTSHGSGTILSLRNINRNDTGVYRCTAWNDYGTKNSSNINVDVKYVDINPGASKLTSETTQDIQLTCSVRGNYGGVVFRSWTQKIGSRLIRMVEGFNTDNETVVKIPYSSYQDVGNYTCYVFDRNGIFLKSKDVEVTVNDKPVITETIKIQEQKGNVEIIVEFYSVPKPFKVDWIKEGTVVSLSEKYRQSNTIVQITLTLHEVRVQLTGYRAKLTITNVTDHDFGTYVLRIENAKGISTQQVNYQQKNQQKGQKEESSALNSTVIGIVIGVSVTVAVTVTIVIVIYFARRRRTNKNKNESVKMNEKIESKYEELQVRTAQQPYDVPEIEVLKKIKMNAVSDKGQNGHSQTQEDKAEYEEIQERENSTFQPNSEYEITEFN